MPSYADWEYIEQRNREAAALHARIKGLTEKVAAVQALVEASVSGAVDGVWRQVVLADDIEGVLNGATATGR